MEEALDLSSDRLLNDNDDDDDDDDDIKCLPSCDLIFLAGSVCAHLHIDTALSCIFRSKCTGFPGHYVASIVSRYWGYQTPKMELVGIPEQSVHFY